MRKDWLEIELGSVLKTTSGGTPSRSKPNFYSGNIPWVKSGELNENTILETEEYISEEAVKNSSAKVFPKGTLLIALYGATIGKLAFLGIEAATNQAVCGIFENKAIQPRFLYYYLFHNRRKLIEQGTGGAQPNISQTILKKLPIKIAPLPEQRAIVARIEELFSELDHSIANLKAAKTKLEVYRQAVLKKAFEGGYASKLKEGNKSNLPNDWSWKSIKEISTILGDGLHGTPKYNEKGDYHFINGNNLNDRKIEIKANTKRVDKIEFEKYKKPLNERTVFVSINGTLGNTAFYNNEKVILGKSACYFNLIESVSKEYILYVLKTNRFLNYANTEATGSTIKNVSLKSMRSFLIPLPNSYNEQTQIVQEIESRLSVADKLAETIQTNLEKAEALRQSILKKAFEGKLLSEAEVEACRKEADWEPTKRLVERIKSELNKPKKS